MYNNLTVDYGEAVRVLAIRENAVSFEELIEVLISHQIRMKIRQLVGVMANLTSSNSDGNPSSFVARVWGRGNWKHGGRRPENGRMRVALPRRDPCSVCGGMGHSPYKYSYRVALSLIRPSPTTQT